MKIRIKFTKHGSMKFISHLDVMRYFQKVMRRAEVDIAYSEGFSPHQIMSFAAPLGLGLTSNGEYMDIEVHSTKSSEQMLNEINEVMVEGMEVKSYRKLDDNAKNAMSLVEAADYTVNYREDKFPTNASSANLSDSDISERFNVFLSQPEIKVLKKTKKSEVETDIKPLILKATYTDKYFFRLATGSANNLKPELVISAFHDFLNLPLGEFDLLIQREEIYGMMDERLIPLEDFGENIN